MATPKAPPGGFKLGGWYDGMQFDGTGFSQPKGVESIGANAGKKVSAEVNLQSDKAQGLAPGTIEKYISQPSSLPTSKESVSPYLADFQSNLFNEATAVEVKTPEQLKSELTQGLTKPPVLNRVSEFEQLRASQGVADLESSLTTLKDQIRAEQDAVRAARGIEEGKPIPMGVITGRISEEERVANERLDNLGRQLSRITDELNTKYSLINTYMNFMGLDYQDAVSAYDKEFEANMKIYDMISAEKKEAKSDARYAQDTAKANLQIYANAITQGNMSYDSLSSDQKLQIMKLEVQSGLPVGTIGSMGLSAKDRILGFSDDKTQAMVIGADGKMSVINTGLRNDNPKGVPEKEAISAMQSKLLELGGSDYLVSPEEWKDQRAKWQQAGYKVESFDNAFKQQFVDWGHPKDYGFGQEGNVKY